MNGLVYFDQFSLIPPVHLALVILGIFVLLGGVWVVSIHSGGGGIDVGTWNEGNDLPRQESMIPDSEDPGSNIQEAAAASMTEQPIYETTNHQARPQMHPVGMERQTLSESNIPTLSTSPQTVWPALDGPTRDSGPTSVPTMEDHRPRPYAQLTYPQGPSRRQRHSVRRELTTDITSMQSETSRSASHSHSSYPQASHLPPLGPVSTLGTGFQIGLSPLSPGFTIVPLDRRRRTSGIGTTGRPSLADVANDIIMGLREERRRTVSEGGLARTLSNEVHNVSRNDGAAVGVEHNMERSSEDGNDEISNLDEPEARRSWRWIRQVFTGKN